MITFYLCLALGSYHLLCTLLSRDAINFILCWRMLWNVVPCNRKLITIKTAITTFNQHLFSLLGRDFRKQDDRNWFRRDQGRGRGRGGPMMYEIHNSFFYFTFYGWSLQFTKGSTMYFVNYSYWQHPTVTVVSFFLTKSQLLLVGLKPCSHFFLPYFQCKITRCAYNHGVLHSVISCSIAIVYSFSQHCV